VFANQNQLRHVLRPDQSFSADQHRVELGRLFLLGWHFVTTTAELPRPVLNTRPGRPGGTCSPRGPSPFRMGG
jgi:hypothetical protein